MANEFSIEDHCYEPTTSSGQPGYTADQLELNRCAFPNCGRPEVEHLWTVEAYMNNEMACRDGG